MTAIRTRFAPSPTGRLHLGHVRAAFEAFGFAQTHSGTCLLRIEDIDHTRCKPDFTRAIYADLDWLGLDWPLPVRVQSAHYADYAKVVIDLLERGLAYPCALSRTQLNAGERSPLRPGHAALARAADILRQVARYKTPSLPFAVRIDLETALRRVDGTLPFEDTGRKHDAAIELALWQGPDPVIARKDISTSYHIAVTHDDAVQGVTHIVRGRDLADQTALHVLIQTLMGWPTPVYHHHDLVLREDGEKLAKRNLDTSLSSLRQAGQSPSEVKRLAHVAP